jgi:hypothetical protein
MMALLCEVTGQLQIFQQGIIRCLVGCGSDKISISRKSIDTSDLWFKHLFGHSAGQRPPAGPDLLALTNLGIEENPIMNFLGYS